MRYLDYSGGRWTVDSGQTAAVGLNSEKGGRWRLSPVQSADTRRSTSSKAASNNVHVFQNPSSPVVYYY